jgi:nitronate monooxygenase
MWPQRRLIELLQIEHPLILAPMAGLGTRDRLTAVRCLVDQSRT